ncbi:hypothetical protein [Sorangium sp. So ce887]|uniref:hypothetical protein n=1 Tax=Sorangium sp. So ce887 TaxID=3133324 RepID=UPI003F61AAE7
MLWTCQCCEYEKQAAIADTCAWCGGDLAPAERAGDHGGADPAGAATFLWACGKCEYEKVATWARYCAWCGSDLVALCTACRQRVDRGSGRCATHEAHGGNGPLESRGGDDAA